MPYLNDRVLDNGLAVLNAEANALHICSAEPATYAEATAAGNKSLGSKATPTVSVPAARSGGGREVTISAVADGSVGSSGTATHWALVDTVNSRLLAAGALAASQAVTAGNTFTLTSFKIGIPGPA